MPSGSAASATNRANRAQETNSEMHESLAALNVAALVPPAGIVDRGSTVAQTTVSSGRPGISGAQVLIGFLLVLCLVGLFVVGIVRFWRFARRQKLEAKLQGERCKYPSRRFSILPPIGKSPFGNTRVLSELHAH